jgi:hypothetical protein
VTRSIRTTGLGTLKGGIDACLWSVVVKAPVSLRRRAHAAYWLGVNFSALLNFTAVRMDAAFSTDG